MEKLLWWTSVLSIVLILMVLTAVRRAHIRVEYSVTWLIACVVLFSLSRSETVLGWIASGLGLGHPTVLILVAGFILVVMFFWTCVVISRLRDDNIALAQRVALLEFHLNRLRSLAGTISGEHQ